MFSTDKPVPQLNNDRYYDLFVCILLQELHVHARCASVKNYYGPVSDREDDPVFVLGDGDHDSDEEESRSPDADHEPGE